MWSLLGIPVVLIGLLVRLNPLVVVTAAAVVAGVGGGLEPLAIVGALGKAFNQARYISLAFLILPLVGLLESAGMQSRARAMVAHLRGLTVGRFLAGYFVLRQVSASMGLLSLGGHAAMVRPLVAPMAESAEAAGAADVSDERRMLIRAHAAGADNIGAFFGEDIFVALGSVLLVQAVLEQNHIQAEPLRIALWAIPTAVVAFVVHGTRLLLLDRRVR
jgi:uncharacterized membrane protein